MISLNVSFFSARPRKKALKVFIYTHGQDYPVTNVIVSARHPSASSRFFLSTTEGVITTRSNRMEFRLPSTYSYSFDVCSVNISSFVVYLFCFLDKRALSNTKPQIWISLIKGTSSNPHGGDQVEKLGGFRKRILQVKMKTDSVLHLIDDKSRELEIKIPSAPISSLCDRPSTE